MIKEIRREDWETFLADFSAMNQAKVLDLVQEDKELGSNVLVKSQPLIAIEPDLEDENFPTIDVIVGELGDDRPATLTHSVVRPKSLYLKESENGVLVGLIFEAENGRTILSFATAGRTDDMVLNL
jgi:hypothetical protein